MEKAIFYCPECAFEREISQTDIPPAAKQCVCPSCRKTFAIAEAITPVKRAEVTTGNQEATEASSEQKVVHAEQTQQDKYQELIDKAFSRLKENDDLEALALFEQAEKVNSTPIARSYLAFCRAKIKYEFSDAVKVCVRCIREESDNAEHYLNLARIYLLANMRRKALQTIQKGLKLGPHPELMKEFRNFERRRSPVFSSLPRDHFLNRNVGKFFSRLGLRS